VEIVLISGLSGSGKSVALRLLEDNGYFCTDNLPAALLQELIAELTTSGVKRLAVAVDSRSGKDVQELPAYMKSLQETGHNILFLVLEARDESLLKRFSETRRSHPLAVEKLEGDVPERTLIECVHEERLRMQPLFDLGHRIDTSDLSAAKLREWVRQFVCADDNDATPSQGGLTLLFESFGFKGGLPQDADLVFDVRCLPNPHYDSELRPFTGLDEPVIAFLESEPRVVEMRGEIVRFLEQWLPDYVVDGRSYLCVAIGCTGGQHRSVYLAHWLSRYFSGRGRVLLRHRNLPPGY